MLSKNESDTLNLIRWLSTIAIVICHILQGYNNIYAWVFNRGVQIFFILSGYLYGNKQIPSIKKFYLGRIVKLYVPYMIWVVVSIALLYIFSPYKPTFGDVLLQITMVKNLPGLNHLWFMRVLAICYLILPLINIKMSKKLNLEIILFAIVSLIVLFILYSPTFLWIALYYIGYLCGRYQNVSNYILILSVIVTFWIIANYGINIFELKDNSTIDSAIHASVGTIIFLVFLLCGKKISYPKWISHLFTSKGGYEIYLTHHLFILGPLSILMLTTDKWFNISLIVLITLLSTNILIKISSFVSKK